MGNGDPPIPDHDLPQIAQAQFEARVPAHAQNDDLSVEVPSFEQMNRSSIGLNDCIPHHHPPVKARLRQDP
jgi:hypothetical protein